MAFQEKVLSLGTLETLLFECPATLAGSAHGVVFSNITNADKTIAVKLYTKSTGVTTVIAQDRIVKANTEFAWPKPINLASGDQIIAMASTLNSVAALVSIYLATSLPASAGFTLRGEHSTIATYDPNDVVSLAGSSYLALSRNVNSPPPSANWMVSALKGDKGEAGLSIATSDEGAQITAATSSLNFTGGGVTATAVGGAVTVNVPLTTRTTLGVDQLDNTADANKPISATQQAALDLKAPLNSPIFTGIVGGVTATMVGLGNVTNTTDANKPVSTAQQAALNLKSDISYVDAKVAALVASAPAALDTLNELAVALGSDANFATTTATSLGNRLRVDAAQGLTGVQQAQGRTNLGLSAVASTGAKADVGLGNVDNTADASKPVSTAQAAAIAAKASVNGASMTALTITGYVETLQIPAAAAAFAVTLANGTLLELTTNANCTITLPAATAGTSFTIIVAYGGVHTLTWAGGGTIKWAGGTAPTATSVAGKYDIFVFTCDGTRTFARSGGGNY